MGYILKATSINTARAIYALNWFDIAPGLIYISQDLRLKVIELGIATTSFYVGLAMFQLVGGAVASRIGSKKVALIGLLILGLAGILSGLSMNLSELIIFRFLAGLGSALFFSPGLSLLRDISPPESYGLQVGIYNGAFNLGGGIGAFGWVFVDGILGWREGLVIGGALSIAVCLENFVVLRDIKEEKSQGTGFSKKLFIIVKSKLLWILSIATIVGMFSETITGQFIIYFEENYIRMTPSQSGFIDGTFLLIGFIGGVVGGHFLSKVTVRKQFSYFILVVTGISFSLIPYIHNFYALSVLIALLGFVTVSVFSILYTLAVDFSPDRATVPFSLSFVNFIQLAIGASSPVAFTFLTDRIGYHYGWLTLGILGLLLISLMIGIKLPSGKPGDAS